MADIFNNQLFGIFLNQQASLIAIIKNYEKATYYNTCNVLF